MCKHIVSRHTLRASKHKVKHSTVAATQPEEFNPYAALIRGLLNDALELQMSGSIWLDCIRWTGKDVEGNDLL